MVRSFLAIPLLAVLPFAAAAQDSSTLNYNYVEGGYLSSEGDGLDLDGWKLKGSVALHPNWHVFGSYARQSYDNDFVDLDGELYTLPDEVLEEARIGVGYNHALAEQTDLVARLAYQRYMVDTFIGDDSFNSYSAEVGVRSAFGERFEGYALAGYQDGGDLIEGDFYGRLGAQVKFTQNWGLSGDVKFADGDAQWFVGPRFSW